LEPTFIAEELSWMRPRVKYSPHGYVAEECTNLDEEGFRNFCISKKLNEETVRANIKMVKEFEAFLKKTNPKRDLRNATPNDLQSFVTHLMKTNKNTWDNLLALLRYARFAGNRKTEVASLTLLDGSDVLESLSNTVKQSVGERKHKEIFEGIELPPLGTPSKDKPNITKKFMERLEANLGEKTCREILLSGPHAGPKEDYLPERKKFLESKGIDDFLERRHKEYVDELEKHMKEKTLYFTQEIDEKVLEYVRNTPTCQNGVRKGNIIYVTKIPYMAKKYLREKDQRKKRYYYCHCPWVREAIKSGNIGISPNFCYCSAGFEKRPWDVIFDRPAKADVIQSVLKGDLVCEFAIHIPKEFLKPGDTTQKK